MGLLYEELTGRILECCFEVMKELGAGFLEAVYEHALLIALRQKGMDVASQFPLQVTFRGELVGQFYADLLVNQQIIVELKAVKELMPEHAAQVINYLKATGIDVGLLVNFGRPKLQYRRFHRKINRDIQDEQD